MNNKKVTIYDIAEKTNFSAVTVHRALNNKGRISEKTRKLILETADSLGYKVNPAAQGLRRSHIKIGAVLFCPVEEYLDDIIDGIFAGGEELEKYNVSVTIEKINYSNNKKCLEELCKKVNFFSENMYNGVIIFASSFLDEIKELSSIIEKAYEKGLLTATVANDIPIEKKVLHIGIDAFMAGNMAAELLEFSCKNKDVALLVASNDSPVNKKYVDGFMNYADKKVFSKVSIYEHFDDNKIVENVIQKMLNENPKLSGIYITTASSALACNYIHKMNRDDLFIVTTDLLSETPQLLKKKIANATIFQNPFRQGKTALRELYNYITNKKTDSKQLLVPHILLASHFETTTFNKSEMP